MDMHIDSVFGTTTAVEDFTLELAADRKAEFDTLLYRGRSVADVEARILEAQFRMPDGSTLLLLNDDTPFKELLTVLLISPGLIELDRTLLGGAFTPGFLTQAYPSGPDEVTFCWHDLDQVARVRRHRTWFGLRSRWLQVREVQVTLPASARDPLHRLRKMLAAVSGLASIRRPTRVPRAR